MPWDADRYHQFQKERAAPFEDALKLVVAREQLRAVDLGCGTGELTLRLADALPGCDMLGIDSSREMLTRAAPHIRPGLRFEQRRIEDFAANDPGGWDLIFAHASLQWVDDHEQLVPRLCSLLSPRGQLVVQVPHNGGHTAHQLIRETAGEAPFAEVLGGWAREHGTLEIDRYAEMLFAVGAASLTVFEKVYPHVLENADAVADWTSGTALVPYKERLGTHYDAFMARYREKLRQQMPGSPLFYGFRRILFSAVMGG